MNRNTQAISGLREVADEVVMSFAGVQEAMEEFRAALARLAVAVHAERLSAWYPFR